MSLSLPTFADVDSAMQRLKGQAIRTTMLRHDILDERAGGPVFIKPECLQHTGSFKFRGAYNALSCLDPEVLRHGVVAYSSGNHAQGVAAAAKLFRVPATIVMPKDAPSVKIEGVLRLGGKIEFYDRETESREEIAHALAERFGAAIIPAFDHPDIIAGQGTAAYEVFDGLYDRNISADNFVCCVGGGGLIAGCGLAAKSMSPHTQIWGIEPDGFDDHRRSLESGQIEKNEQRSGSLCDALLSPSPGQLTFELNKRQLSGIETVSDDDALAAMAFAFQHFKIVLEPGGAVALAAVLAEKIETKGKTTVVMATGGNVEPNIFARALGFGQPCLDDTEGVKTA